MQTMLQASLNYPVEYFLVLNEYVIAWRKIISLITIAKNNKELLYNANHISSCNINRILQITKAINQKYLFRLSLTFPGFIINHQLDIYLIQLHGGKVCDSNRGVSLFQNAIKIQIQTQSNKHFVSNANCKL